MLERAPESWPPRPYAQEFARRVDLYRRLRRSGEWTGAHHFYKHHPVAWATDWCVTYDPRNAGDDNPALIPFVPFRRQQNMFQFVYACLAARANGLIEKSRDMGATWIACYVSIHLWRYGGWNAYRPAAYGEGPAVGWGSRKATLVDKLGDPDSIFQKMRVLLRYMPAEMLPRGFVFDEHVNLMRIVNPETGATITGEAGDDIGRGGRKRIYFKDESAHYEHPEPIEASLMENTDVQIDMSSVNGLGNVFHRKREAGLDWSPGSAMVRDRTNVLVLDWRDHPGKDQKWYDTRKTNAYNNGLQTQFAQEVDRDYSAAVEGTIIPAAWVRSALDAHILLGIKITGRWASALDVADEGGDTNAHVQRQGIVLRLAEEWGDRDTGVTTRKVVDAVNTHHKMPLYVQYDSVGVGSGVKAEFNRLRKERTSENQAVIHPHLRFVPWNGGAAVVDPEKRVIPGDRDSPLNEDLFANFKAQAWWALRRRFELTHRAVQKTRWLRGEFKENYEFTDAGFTWEEDQLISVATAEIESGTLWKLVKELSQPTVVKRVGTLKMLVDKKPDGTKSPNLADAVVMCYFPAAVPLPTITSEALRRI